MAVVQIENRAKRSHLRAVSLEPISLNVRVEPLVVVSQATEPTKQKPPAINTKSIAIELNQSSDTTSFSVRDLYY